MDSVEALTVVAEQQLPAAVLRGCICEPASPNGRRRALVRGLLVTCRPRQWVKNLLVLAAPAAAGVLGRPSVLLHVLLALFAFCLLSSATYLVNDVRDRHQDRVHHVKRFRPVAAGVLSPALALGAAAGLAVAGLAVTVTVGIGLFAIAAGYLALTLSYTLWLRHQPVADIVAVAAGFVTRAIAGGVAANVGLSHWFLLVTSFGALFVVGGKRYAELTNGMDSLGTRPVLRAYSPRALRAMLAATALLSWMSYGLWVVDRPDYDTLVWGALTVIPFSLWLARYARLLGHGAGEAPEQLVLGDRLLLLLSLCWLVLFTAGVYVS